MTLYQKIINSFVVRTAYKAKFYTDLGISQFSWATGKLPEIMAVAYLVEKMGRPLQRKEIIWLAGAIFVIFFVVGYTWKKLGLYDVEQYVIASKNPVQNEILNSSRNINQYFKLKGKKNDSKR